MKTLAALGLPMLMLLPSVQARSADLAGAPRYHHAACELGAVILARLPETGMPRDDQSVYDASGDFEGADRSSSNLFKACPELSSQLPAHVRVATDDERKRATDLRATDPLTIFWVSAPTFHRDFTEAEVWSGYRCPGLCAGTFVSVYKHRRGRWTLTVGPRLVSVS